MTLESFFYVYAIIFMTLCFAMLIAIVVAVFYMKSKIDEIQHQIETKIENLKSKPQEIAMDLGTTVALKAIKGIQNFVTKKDRSK